MSIEELEHTADLRFRVRAPTLSALFAEAARALMQTLYADLQGPATECRSIELESEDGESLLYNFLSEVLFLSEAENLVFSAVELTVTPSPPSVIGRLGGRPFDPAVHAGGTEVKGISYSDLAIRETGGEFCLEVLFDV